MAEQRRVSGTSLRIGVLLLAAGFAAGSLFGPTIVTAAQNIRDVFVVNTSSDPVPVSGTVNVGNLPATQPVSGTVNVGSMPTPAPVSEGVTQSGTTSPGQSATVQVITNVVAVTFWSDGLAYMIIGGNDVGNGYQLTSPGGQTVVQTFVNPVPSTEVTVTCDPINATSCRWRWAVGGI